jgi:uncharacterized membrane protein YukC
MMIPHRSAQMVQRSRPVQIEYQIVQNLQSWEQEKRKEKFDKKFMLEKGLADN